MKESRFINLTGYCLVEYMFEDLGSLNFISDDFVLLQNDYSDTRQIFNEDGSFETTRNIRDLTAVAIDGSRYVYLDSEKIPDYVSYDDNITETTITGNNVIMDKVRFHFVSGFDFDDFRAMVLTIKHRENDGRINVFANMLLNPDTMPTAITFNPKPMFFSNALYDRYVDVYVPSIKNINEEFNTAALPQNTFAAAITPVESIGQGFIVNDPITIAIDECATQEILTTDLSVSYDSYTVSNHIETSLSQSNEFDGVGAWVNEAASGDFIEFYLTFNGGFPEELISILNRRNPADRWVIIHELSIFEQVGSTFINTARQVFFQEDDFDEAQIFRPVLKNANEAVTMSIDYLARLFNKRTGEQIIREGSYIQPSPKKYGKNLLNIPLRDKPQSQRVYNKIIKKNFEATKLFIDPQFAPNAGGLNDSNTTIITQTEYVPLFFNSSKVILSHRSAQAKDNDLADEVIFAQGDLRFILSPFDNYLRFKIYTLEKGEPVPLDLNLNDSKYRAVFVGGSGDQIKVDNVGDQSKENPAEGEIAFNVPKKSSEEIMESSDKTFYITSVAKDGSETMMYNGEWRFPSEQDSVEAAIAKAKAEFEETNQTRTKISEIETKLENARIKLDRFKFAAGNRMKLDIPGFVSKRAKRVPTVNRIGIKKPTGLTANRKNKRN